MRSAFPVQQHYSPYAGRNFPTRVFWGDTHVHTAFSMDAGAFGARLTPEDAYRFARGEELTSSTGQRVKLSRPLDFLVVADHSDNMGFFPRLFAGDPSFLADPTGKRWYDMIKAGGQEGVKVAIEVIAAFSQNKFPPALASLPGTPAYRSAWETTVKAADKYNDPGRFSAFIGYEWTSNTGGNNLHRVVIYRDAADKALQMEPYTTLKPLGSDNPRDLWKWLQSYEQKTGGSVLAIAHNGNLSNGIMFPEVESFTGRPVDKEYAETRAKWEPLYEVTQIKGDGEAHPFLSPTDEFANYEIWDQANLDLSVPKQKPMLQYEYARTALQTGLQLEAKLGTNPYKFGMIGSTDTHTALATAEEDNFFGKHSGAEPSPDRYKHPMAQIGDRKLESWSMVSSGYAGVWAADNTREAIFDAMMRKETYATTGPRMIVRFFGGWDFDAEGCADAQPGGHRLRQRRADGRRSPCRRRRQGADVPRRSAEGSDRRKPRPYPDRQGLGRRRRPAAGEDLQRGLVGRSQARRRRQAAGGGQYGRRRRGDLDQHDRRTGADHGVEGSRIQSRPARRVLRPRARRSRRRAGPPTKQSASTSRCRPKCRW